MLRALLVDVGNSFVRIARWDAAKGELVSAGAERIVRISEQATPRTAATRRRLAGRLVELAKGEGGSPVVLASVVPDVTAAIQAAMPRVLIIDHTWSLPFGLDVADPAAVGADRLCNLAAAAGRGWPDALVVDAGTATTFDLMQQGIFRGGLIAPGMAFSARRLGEMAARLKPVTFAYVPLAVGRDTESAMRGGAFHVGVQGIIGTIEALLSLYGPLPVVVTGGLGQYLHRDGWHGDPDWTFRGAAWLGRPFLNSR